MLKVKDNIDLEELEKYGFDSVQLNEEETIYYIVTHKDFIRVSSKDRILHVENYRITTEIFIKMKISDITAEEIIFDLTKADILEKISEEEKQIE